MKARLLLGLGVWLLSSACVSQAPRAAPSIEFTTLPPAGLGSPVMLDTIAGRVTGARPGEKIVLLARSGVWWVQPTTERPFTAIEADATFKNSTHPGSAYAALLVAADYFPAETMAELPKTSSSVLAVATAEGHSLTHVPAKTLEFSGYQWELRNVAGNPGGTQNYYDPANAWVDRDGFLHLRIARFGEDWTAAEASLSRSLGYGSYRFVVRDVSKLEPAAVLSMSTWDDAGPPREMNIEISRWGEPTSKNAQFVVQPYFVPANTFRFDTGPGTHTYGFRWEPGRVTFQAELNSKPASGSKHTFTSGVPSSGSERIHLNLYVYHNPRNPLEREVEVIVEKFEYLP